MALAPTLPGELYANFGFFALIIAFLYGYFLAFSSVRLRSEIAKRKNIEFPLLLYMLVFLLAIRSVMVGFGGIYFLLFSLFVRLVFFSLLDEDWHLFLMVYLEKAEF